MALPALAPSPHAPLRRNLSLDLASWIGIGITSALLGSIVPAVARQEGIDPLGIAILAVIPYAASLLAVFAGRVGPRVPVQLAILRAVGAAALAFVLVGPSVLWVVLAASLYWVAHFVGMPVQQRLWGVIYPEARRGRSLSLISTGRYAGASVAFIVAASLAAHLDGAVIIAIGGILGAALALATSRISSADLGSVQAFSVRGAIGAVWGERYVRQLTLAHALFGAGMAMAIPLLTLIQVDRVGLDLAAVGISGMAGAVATLGSLFGWGVLADRRGTVVVLQAGAILGVAGLALYAVAGDVLAVLGAAALIGLSNGAIEVGFAVLIANHVPASRQAAATAGSNAIFGIRGLIAPVAMVALLQVGAIDLDGAIALCVVASLGGAILYLRVAVPEGLRDPSLGRAVAGLLGGMRRSRTTVTSSGQAVASAIGSRFAALR